MNLSAYDVLRKACGFANEIPPKNCDFISTALFLDWDKAKEVFTDGQLDSEGCWDLFFRIGFIADRILPFADAGIRPIVKRIVEMNWLTDECCSGHADDKRTHPYIGIVFPYERERKSFVTLCKQFFARNGFGLEIGSNKSHKVVKKCAGSKEPYTWFHDRRVTTSFWWTTKTDTETQEVWKTFSEVLSVYDKKDKYVPSLSGLCLYDMADEGFRMLQNVYAELCMR